MLNRIVNHAEKLVRQGWAINRPTTLLAGATVVTAAVGIGGIFVDPRLITGAPAWAKTTKFSLSIFTYAVTMLWMLPYIRVRARLIRLGAGVAATILLIEMGLIILQAARGEAMHFNNSTPLNATLFSFMGASISVFWLINMAIAVALMWQRLPNPSLTWGVRLALLISIIGMGQGYLMVQPSAQQRARMQQGEQVDYIGGHTVGAEDADSPGLPFVGWSTEHGDLRIGHFVGLHGLQAIALLGWWVGRRREGWLLDGDRVALVVTGATGYLGLVGVLTWQALRAQPLLRPDALTLSATAGLIGTTATVAASILIRARSRTAAPALQI